MSSGAVVHRPDEQCFVLERQDQQARLDYQLIEGATTQVDFHHTYVPVEFRGQGLAEQLVQAGLSWAAQQNFQVHASCWYVAKVQRANASAVVAAQRQPEAQ